MSTHSSILAWRIPGTEEPGGLPSMGSHRVGHDWSDLAAAAMGKSRTERLHDLLIYSDLHIVFLLASLMAQLVKNLPAVRETQVWFLGQEIPLRRKGQPTPVLFPGKSNGQRSLVGCSPWGHRVRQEVATEQEYSHMLIPNPNISPPPLTVTLVTRSLS